jgi:BASS family bile acid:Na+ symporter
MTEPGTMGFSAGNLAALNAVVAFLMYSVAMTLTPDDFRRVVQRPLAPIGGLAAQFILLPAVTCLATWLLGLPPALALGAILVASCPGGSLSNIITWRAGGNVALSVSMTAVSSLAATVLTPANFALYGWLNPITRAYLRTISIPADGILALMLLVLGLPLALGMLTRRFAPQFVVRAERPLRRLSFVFLLAFIAVAFGQHFDLFIARFNTFFWLVLGQNALALATGFTAARLLRLPEADVRAVTIEVGIQNVGLGLVILTSFFPGEGEMMLVTAFWGVWHLVSGLTLSAWWVRRPLVPA